MAVFTVEFNLDTGSGVPVPGILKDLAPYIGLTNDDLRLLQNTEFDLTTGEATGPTKASLPWAQGFRLAAPESKTSSLIVDLHDDIALARPAAVPSWVAAYLRYNALEYEVVDIPSLVAQLLEDATVNENPDAFAALLELAGGMGVTRVGGAGGRSAAPAPVALGPRPWQVVYREFVRLGYFDPESVARIEAELAKADREAAEAASAGGPAASGRGGGGGRAPDGGAPYGSAERQRAYNAWRQYHDLGYDVGDWPGGGDGGEVAGDASVSGSTSEDGSAGQSVPQWAGAAGP